MPMTRHAHELAQELSDYIEEHRPPEPTEAQIGTDLERQGGVGFINMTNDDEQHIRRGIRAPFHRALAGC